MVYRYNMSILRVTTKEAKRKSQQPKQRKKTRKRRPAKEQVNKIVALL